MFSRQYHIHCLSTQKHVQFHICIYFRFSAVNITLIDVFLCTLLYLAGFILNLMRFAEILEK